MRLVIGFDRDEQVVEDLTKAVKVRVAEYDEEGNLVSEEVAYRKDFAQVPSAIEQ